MSRLTSLLSRGRARQTARRAPATRPSPRGAPLVARIEELEAEVRHLRAVAAGAAPDGERVAGPIFVGGTGRSGTWVLGRMIGRHPDIVTARTELRFHAAGGGFRKVLAGEESPADYAARVRRRRFDRVPAAGSGERGISLVATREQLEQATQRLEALADHDITAALRAFTHTLVDPYALGHAGRTWVDTTPENIAVTDSLHQVFPTAKAIHTVRDGRDVAASIVTQPWGPTTFDEALDVWATRLRAAHHGTRHADPQRLLTIRLEELIHLHRDREFDRIVRILDLTDPQPLRTYFDQAMNADRAHVGRWRHDVPPAQRDAIDQHYRHLYDQLTSEGITCLPTDPDTIDQIHHASTA